MYFAPLHNEKIFKHILKITNIKMIMLIIKFTYDNTRNWFSYSENATCHINKYFENDNLNIDMYYNSKLRVIQFILT